MSRDGIHILAVDDSRAVLGLLQRRLSSMCDRLTLCRSVAEAESVLAREPVDVALLDLELGDGSGIALCRRIKSEAATRDVAVLFLSGESEVETKVQCLSLGAIDYVVKPFHPDELRARVTSAIRLKTACDLLTEQAEIDSLTGLGNRRRFEGLWRSEVSRCVERAMPLAIALIDIDHFKATNDEMGHPVGDRVLAGLARLLSQEAIEGMTLCRIGGDELAAVMPVCLPAAAAAWAEAGLQRVKQDPHLGGLAGRRVTLSIGVAGARPGSNADADRLIEAADVALYEAKGRGRARVCVAEGASRGGMAAA